MDEHTGELLFFNYSHRAPYMHYGVVDTDDNLVALHRRAAARPAAAARHGVHRELLDPVRPADVLGAGGARARQVRHPVPPRLPLRIAVFPRHGRTEDIRWFEADPTYVLHWVNAYEEGDEIVLDGFFQTNPEPPAGNGTLYQRMFRFLDADVLGPRLHRWRLNLRPD